MSVVTVTRSNVAVAEVHDLRAYREDRHQACLAEARDLMLEGQEDEALERCFEALKVRENSYEALSLAGTLLAILGQAEASVIYTQQAIHADDSRPDAYYDLGSTLLDLDRSAEALDWLERGSERLGERSDDLVDFMYSARIEALANLRRLPEARALLEEARERTKDPLQLLESAQAHLEAASRRPVLRLV